MPTITIPEGSTAVVVVTDKSGALDVIYEGVDEDERDMALAEAVTVIGEALADLLAEDDEPEAAPDGSEEEEEEPEEPS